MSQATQEILENILNPGSEYTPIPFWFLNDKLDKAELERQLIDFKDKGVDAVVVHPRIGLPEDFAYLSGGYFDVIRFIVRLAFRLEMKIVLYDEAMYPSGSAHGEVVRENPSFASVGITRRARPGNGKVIAVFKDGSFLVQDFSGGTIRGIHFGEDDGEANAPASADILNPDAVERFIELTHDRYYSNLKDYFGNVIIGFFTDEPCVLGRNTTGFFDWTNGLEKDILASGGVLEELEGLFTGVDNKTVGIYKEMVKKRLNEVYYAKLFAWCEAHGIALMGHPEHSDDIDQQQYFHIPGQDLIMRRISPEEGGLSGMDSVQAKCSADAARHTAKRRNSNECFGVCARQGHPWHFTGGDMKWYIDWLGVRGVNLFIPHAFYYSLRGERKDERPPDVGPNNIWWKHYKQFSDYMKRLSYLMTDSVNCATVAVVCESGNMPSDEMKEFYQNQIEFNYVQSALLDNLCKDALHVNGYQYNAYLSRREWNFTAKRISSAADVTTRDFVAKAPCFDLRATHLVKNQQHLYFFTNEGNGHINTNGTVPVTGTPVYVDLWNARYWKGKPAQLNGRTELSLSLPPRESLLVLFAPSNDCVDMPPKREQLIDLYFSPSTGGTSNTIAYTAEYTASRITGDEAFVVCAEEMVECYCNGVFVGASFWNPHKFSIGNALQAGRNEIRLIVTGSAANKFQENAVPFGLLDADT